MLVFHIALGILFAAVIGTALSRKLHLPLELTLLLASLAIALVPGIPRVHINSEVVFFILLPPILFSAAYFTSWNDFKRNLRPISLLALGLVIFTVCGVAIVAKWIVPQLSWPAAFLLGAIISPPDASAATAVTKKIGLPRRIQTILEGESLINDATALVCYRFALGALLSGTFSVLEGVGQFLLVGIGGAFVGLAVAALMIQLLLRIRDASAEALLSLVTSFFCFLAAESLHLSGVIATVAGGLYFGRAIPRYASPEARVEAKALWDVALLAINGLVFALIGLQLPSVLEGLGPYGIKELCIWAFTLLAAIILIRFIWIFPATWLPRLLVPGLAKRDPLPPWQALVVIAWTGMRGIVSLAAAIAIPEVLPDGRVFGDRDLIIFLSYSVILMTLILPTLTLPALLRWISLPGGQESVQEEIKARLAMARTAVDEIEQISKGDISDCPLLIDMNRRYQKQLERFAPNLETNAYSVIDPSEQEGRLILIQLFESERKELHKMRSGGEIHDEVFHHLEDELDFEVLRVRRNMRPI